MIQRGHTRSLNPFYVSFVPGDTSDHPFTRGINVWTNAITSLGEADNPLCRTIGHTVSVERKLRSTIIQRGSGRVMRACTFRALAALMTAARNLSGHRASLQRRPLFLRFQCQEDNNNPPIRVALPPELLNAWAYATRFAASGSTVAANCLEGQFQHELDDARTGTVRNHSAEIGGANIAYRIITIGMIQDIEELRADLNTR